MQEFASQFPVLSNYTYLNTASCGLLSESLVAWRREEDNSLLHGGSIYRDTHKPRIESIRKTVASFFKAGEHEVALIPNFSFGLNTLLEGIPKGQKVLLLEKDYPSINWSVERHGFELCYATIDENLEQNIERAVAEHRPDIFAFSIVQYLNGIKIDFEFLRKLKAYNPKLLLIADGTQYFGTEPFSFAESPIDIVGCSAYKWLLAGYGNGFLMIKEAAQAHISPKTIGFNSADASFGKKDDIPFMKFFEPGHQDTLNYGSLEQSIQYLIASDFSKISEKIKRLSALAKDRFAEKGLLDDATLKRQNHSNIFNLGSDEQTFQKLKENKVICSLRGHGIRVGFHFYNSEDDLAKLITFF
jgi:selenocysteine lyase/cysteine desulfurase